METWSLLLLKFRDTELSFQKWLVLSLSFFFKKLHNQPDFQILFELIKDLIHQVWQ